MFLSFFFFFFKFSTLFINIGKVQTSLAADGHFEAENVTEYNSCSQDCLHLQFNDNLSAI